MKRRIVSILVSVIITIACGMPFGVFADNDDSESSSELIVEYDSSMTIEGAGEEALETQIEPDVYPSGTLFYSIDEYGAFIVGHQEYIDRMVWDDETMQYYNETICVCDQYIRQIPSEINHVDGESYPVIRIQSGAFCCDNLKNITIPASVKKIEDSAIVSPKLQTITIDGNVAGLVIGKENFTGAECFFDVNIPAGVIEIGEGCFVGSKTNISVDADNPNYASINGALYDKGITYLIYAGNPEQIFVLPKTVETIVDGAFDGVSVPVLVEDGNTHFVAENGTLYSADKTQLVYSSNQSETTVIASGNCGQNLTWELTNEGRLDIYGDGELSCNPVPWKDYKEDIKTVVFQGAITSMPADNVLFSGCANLTSIAFIKNIGGYFSNLGDNAITEIETSRLITGCKNTRIPQDVTAIGRCAFDGSTGLGEIMIPIGVEEIGEAAFSNCSGLEKITILNPECFIFDAASTIPSTAVIYGASGSTAQTYATKYNCSFVPFETTSIADAQVNGVTVILNGMTLTENVDFVVNDVYREDYYTGEHYIDRVYTGIGNYTGSVVYSSKNDTYNTQFDDPEYIFSPFMLDLDLHSDLTLTLSWKSIPEVEQYEIFYAEDSGKFERITKLDKNRLSYTVTNLKEGSIYYFYVVATDGVHGLACSERGTVVALDTPTLNEAVLSDGGITLNWSKTSGTNRYNIYRCSEIGGNYEYLTSVQGVESYVDKNVESGKTYYYKVRAYKKFGYKAYYGGYSNAVGKAYAFSAVPKLNVAPKSGVTMTISWGAVSGVYAYELWCAKDGEEFALIKSAGRNQTSTSHTSLTAGTRYSYMIVAKDSTGNILAQTGVKAAVALVTPTLNELSLASGGIKLTWTKASGADRYNIYRSETENGTYEYVESVQKVESFVDMNVEHGKTYYYKVRAYKKIDGIVYYGGYSNKNGISCSFAKVPTVRVAPKSGVTMTISWGTVSGANTYEIWYAKDGDSFSLAKVAGKTQTSTSHTGLTAGTRYSYKIVAKDRDGNIVAVSEMKKSVALATPKLISVVTTDDGVELSWSKASGADRYNVYRSTSENGNYEYIESVQKVEAYVDTTAQAGVTYYYKVRAYKKIDGIVYYGGYSDGSSDDTPESITDAVVEDLGLGASKFRVTIGTKVLEENVDYRLASVFQGYDSMGNAIHEVTITGIGRYQGTIVFTVLD
ncbi:MAG: leucine-rich repeat protein [Clostridiales bacterium]|nr:leucine-rich repeat protein [Clostridiales bacterium]